MGDPYIQPQANSFLGPQDNTDNLARQTKADVPLLESLHAATLSDETAVTKIQNYLDLKKIEDRGGEKLQPSELNKIYPDLNQPFDRAMNKEAAAEIYNRQQKKAVLSRIAEEGPDGYLAGGLKLGAGLVSHALDPVEFGAGVVTGGVFGAGFGLAEGLGLKAVSKFGTSLGYGLTAEQIEQRSLIATFGSHAFQGVTGNAALEPINAITSQAQGEKYDFSDIAENALYGGIGFAGLQTAIHGVMRFGKSSKLRYLEAQGAEYAAAADRIAIGQTEAGKKINIEPLVEQRIAEIYEPKESTHPNPDKPLSVNYEYQPVSGDNIKGKVFSSPTKDVNPNFNESQKFIVGEDYGDALYLTDNEVTANNEGRMVHQFEVKDNMKLLDLEQPLKDQSLKDVSEAAESLGISKPGENATTKDVLNNIKKEIDSGTLAEPTLNKFNEVMASKGYDGYIHSNETVMDKATPKENVVALFNQDKINKIGEFQSDETMHGSIDSSKLQEIKDARLSPESDIGYNQDARDMWNQVKEEKPVYDFKDTELNKEYDAVKERLNDPEKVGDQSPETKKELEELKNFEQKEVAEKSALKLAFKCLTG